MTFAELFDEYMKNKILPEMSENRIKSVRVKIGSVDEISEVTLLEVLRATESRGMMDTATLSILRGINFW